MNIVKRYDAVDELDVSLVGSKAWAIARLAQQQNRIRVPKGFCITSALTTSLARQDQTLAESYRAFLECASASGVADERLAHQLERRIQELKLDADTTSELASALRENIPSHSPRVIVRSSASIEDSVQTSFAGQFKSIVAEKNLNALVGAIKLCWIAVTSRSLVAYAFARKVRLSGIAFSFLVQEYIDFDYAGVLFTKIPGKEPTGDFIVEYTKGGAEQVVSGRGNPIRCILKGGVERAQTVGAMVESGEMQEEQLLRLGLIAKEIKNLFGRDQDIEWGMRSREIYVLQSRPITV